MQAPLLNKFFEWGKITNIKVSEARGDKPASATILLQYGKSRQQSEGAAVQFVNAVPIRLPAKTFAAVREDLKVGQEILVEGRHQGVYKEAPAQVAKEGTFLTELYADRVTIIRQPEDDDGSDKSYLNKFFQWGKITRVKVSEGKGDKPASAVILLQYGKPRQQHSGGPVEFVSTVPIRIPSYRFPELRDQIQKGLEVVVEGHHQGVYKEAPPQVDAPGTFSAELVADRVSIRLPDEAESDEATEVE